MIVEDVMSFNPFFVEKSASVRDVARAMLDRKIGSALVVENGRVVGIVTDRDVFATMTKRKVFNVDDEPISRIMSNRVHFIGAEAPADKALEVMEQFGVKKLPVMKGGQIRGIVTFTDIVKEELDDANLMRYVARRWLKM